MWADSVIGWFDWFPGIHETKKVALTYDLIFFVFLEIHAMSFM